MRRFTLHFLLVMGMLIGFARQATAESVVPGFSIALQPFREHLAAVEEGIDENSAAVAIEEVAGGLGVTFGWGFSPAFVLRATLEGAPHETDDPDIIVVRGSLIIDGLYLFRDPDALRPFLSGGIGVTGVIADDGPLDYGTVGPSLNCGAGFYFFPTQHFALDFTARADFINWDARVANLEQEDGSTETIDVPIEEKGTALHVGVGASWWF